jgi:hypothetical protein
MTNIFSQAIDDIFAVDDFIEILTTGNLAVRVSSYVGTTAETYTEYGYDHGDSIAITCKCADWQPARGDKVQFRGKDWKVSEYETDSHALTFRVNLKSIESK